MSSMNRAQRMQAALAAAFQPTMLTIEDESARHAGHAGASPAGETHFCVTMASPAFAGMNRVARSRAVHEALAPEFLSGLHALSLRLRAPNEV
jgi:stress-induced morphogen